MVDKDVGPVFNKPSMEIDYSKLRMCAANQIGEAITYVDTSGKNHHSKPPMEIVIPEFRMFKTLNGEMVIINEDYWDSEDDVDDTQGYNDLERKHSMAQAEAELLYRYRKMAIRRVEYLVREEDNLDVDVQEEVNQAKERFEDFIDCIFLRHKREMALGYHDGHGLAIRFQHQYWKQVGGYMKTILRLKYQAIGFDPDVWCK